MAAFLSLRTTGCTYPTDNLFSGITWNYVGTLLVVPTCNLSTFCVPLTSRTCTMPSAMILRVQRKLHWHGNEANDSLESIQKLCCKTIRVWIFCFGHSSNSSNKGDLLIRRETMPADRALELTCTSLLCSIFGRLRC